MPVEQSRDHGAASMLTGYYALHGFGRTHGRLYDCSEQAMMAGWLCEVARLPFTASDYIVGELRKLKIFAIPVLALFAAAAGCDLTGQYEPKFKQALEVANRRSAFDALLHRDYTEMVDAARQPIGVKLRLPKLFDGESKVLPQTAIPGLTDLQGSAYTLMKDLDDDSGQKAACIVQIVAVPKAAQKGEPVQATITKLATALVAGAKWEDISLPSPSGQPQGLKRMHLDKQMPQMNEKGGGGKMVPGLIDIYEVDGGANVVVVTWLALKPQAQKHNLERAIEASMGTVEVAGAPGGDAAGGGGGKAATGCF